MAAWTTEHLKEHLTALMAAQDKAVLTALAAQEKAVAAALAAAKEAVNKAEVSVDERLKSMNEFRATLSDQATRLMPREEAVTRIDALRERMETLASRVTGSEGRSRGLGDGWGWLIGAVGLIGSIVAIALSLLHR
jgi:uncharacterized membrane protein